MSKRGWILVGSAIPAFGLLALLGWASVQSGGNPGSLGVNSKFGQEKVSSGPAKEFSLELLGGGTLALSELRGKVVMVDFWSSWCVPCRQEAPVLAEVYREYREQPVEFVGVDIWDRPSDALEFVNRFGTSYPTGVDANGAIAIDYGVTGIPEKFFISPEGVLVKKFVGPMKAGKLREILDEMLGAAAPSPAR